MESEDMNSDDDVYEVEKIVDNVIVGGKTYYRVRWKNYGEAGDTWEPRENLLSCEDLLNNYIRMETEKTTGLTLSSDVFTAGGTGDDSGSDSSKREEKKGKAGRPGRKKNVQKIQKEKSKKSSKIIEDSSSSSSDEPQVKDDFWEKLKEGKIDVFASDLYSKVKQRRPPEKEVDDQQHNLPPEITGKGKKRGPKKRNPDDDQKEKDELEDAPIKVKKKPGRKPKNTARKAVDSDLDDGESLKSLAKTLKNSEKKKADDEEENRSEQSNDSEPNLVLQYLESEREVKKVKKRGKPPKDKDEKSEKRESKKVDTKIEKGKDDVKRSEKRTLTINLDDPNFAEKTKEELKRGTSVEKKVEAERAKKVIKPTETEKVSVNESDFKGTELPVVEGDKTDLDVELRVVDSKKKKKKKKVVTEETSDSEKVGDSDRSEAKNEVNKEAAKEKGAFDVVDAFSVQLQESDQAYSDFMLKKKEKSKKHKQQQSAKIVQDKQSPPVPPTSAGSSVLEMLTQEMERTVSVSSDPKSNATYEGTLKEVHSQFGLEAPKLPPTEPEKPEKARCSPEMMEFLKIKVNFELDEISLKDIERHHEMGEPPCRLEKDITNAEFRQYIRQNNFEMVHEALKSKKMMYNLEHTDAMWMTQLMVAAYDGFDEIVKILAHHGARVNARTKNGSTALIIAADKGRDIVCRILIAYGAYINLATTSGETALMKAAKHGHTMIVRYLLQAGADPMLKSAHGTSALDNAEKGNHLPLMSLIKDHETNITAHVNECIHRECHSLSIKTIGLPILAARLYNIRETPLIHITFNSVMQNIPANQGLMLFVVHGMIGSGLSIKCRMRGPCFVQAVTLNNFVMDPMMPAKQTSDENTHFITNLIWRTGQNSLKLFVAQDALSSEKLFVCIFQCGFVD